METMFNTLLQLPLFQGLCQEDFTTILEKVKFRFTKHKTGDIIIESGTTCHRLCFLLKGKLSVVTRAKTNIYTVIEQVEAPYLIEPQSLFGMRTTYVSSYVAQTVVHTVSIDKEFVLNDLFNYDIFRLNYMNIVSNYSQALYLRLWSDPKQDLKGRIIHFFLLHCGKLQGEKIFKMKKEDLAHYLDHTRLNTSKALNELQNAGLIELRRKEIIIPDIQKLIGD